MKATTAISKFMKVGNYPKVGMAELKEFKESCTADEWEEFGRQSCDIMGTEFEPKA